MENKNINLNIDLNAIKKQYNEHASKCQKIYQEVDKWGKKTAPKLKFLIKNN